MKQEFWALFLILAMIGFHLCFVEEFALESGHSPSSSIVQMFNKDLFPSPATFVFRICL